VAAESPHAPPTPPDEFEITIPLRVEFATTLRTVVAGIGSDAGFSLDELDDLRLALSEVFSVLAETAALGRRARVSCSMVPGKLSISVSSDPPGVSIELDDLATRILQSVVDDVTIDTDTDIVTFTKRSIELGEPSRRA